MKDKTKAGPKPPRATRAKAKPTPAKRPAAATDSAVTTPPASPSVPAPASASQNELEHLRGELQRVNHELSRIGRVTRPGVDPLRQLNLPEKQRLMSEKLDIERRIRGLSRS